MSYYDDDKRTGSGGKKPYDRKPSFNGERRYGDKPRGNRYGESPDKGKRYGSERKYDGKQRSDRPYDGDSYYKSERRFGDRQGRNERFDRKFEGREMNDRSFEKKSRFDYESRPFNRDNAKTSSDIIFVPHSKATYNRDNAKAGFDRRPRKPYDERGRFDDKKRDFGAKRFEKEREFSRRKFEQPALVPIESEPTELPNIIMGRNPVKEAIKSGSSIDRILVIKGFDGSLGEIITLAHEANLVIKEVERFKLDEICMPFGHNGKPGNHQGIVAEIPGVEYADIQDILDYAQLRNEKPFIVLLDGIEDPHNLGSIIRSAECAGAHGVVITKRRSASVTASVVKTSAGAAEHMRIARVPNLAAVIDELKQKGLWIVGADMEGKSMYETDMKGAFGLVIGNEGNGLGKLVKEKCDFLVSIPLKGHIDSLNAGVAGAVIMFEKNRQELNG